MKHFYDNNQKIIVAPACYRFEKRQYFKVGHNI